MISLKRCILWTLVLFGVVCLEGGVVHSSDLDDDVVADEIVFQLAVGASLQAVLTDYGLSLVDSVAGVRTYLASVGSIQNEGAVVAQMLLDTRILGAEEHRLAETPEGRFRTIALADGTKGLGDATGQDALALLGVSAAPWDGTGVVVAILDTGIGPHPDLDAVTLPGMDFIDEDSDPSDVGDSLDDDGDGLVDEGTGHGTHVAGIVHMVAPGAMLMPVRVLNSDGQGSVFSIARGIRYAVDHGARVLNCSWGLINASPSIKDALEYAHQRGVVIVSSAGNGNREVPEEFPSNRSNVISVAATDLSDHRASFSNYNDDVDITAPGVSILSMYHGGADYATWSGTSMSAPFVSGAVVLVMEARPDLSKPTEAAGERIMDLVEQGVVDISAQNPGFDGLLGRGRLDIGKLASVLKVPGPEWWLVWMSLLWLGGLRRRRGGLALSRAEPGTGSPG